MTDSGLAPVRIGLVGAGGIALSHMNAIRTSPHAELSVICDTAVDRARSAAIDMGSRWTGDLDELLADPEVDAVILCTPNSTHEALGERVLRAGKHLLVEKPLAMTLAGADRLISLAEQFGLALAVGHSHRFSDQSLALAEVLAAGTIGEPRFVRIVMNGGWIWPGWQHWVLNPEVSGGHSLHNGVHLMDLASWWIGDRPVSVYSRGQRVTSAALDIADYLVTQVEYAGGASAICEVSRAERPRNAAALELTVVGTEGSVSREWDADGLLRHNDDGFSAPAPSGSAERTFVRELESFVAATRTPGTVIPPVSAAREVTALAIASELSLATNRVISLGEIQ